MNKFMTMLMILFMIMSPSIATAATVTLSDGQTINLDGLSDMEKSNMLKYIEKIDKNNEPSIINNIPTNPDDLQKWSKLITGTIKDVCNDLSITVNDFVKTPVGLGIAGLITYKVIGKDLLEKVFDIVFVIPMWITVTIILGFITRQFLGNVTVYKNIVEKDGKIVEKSNPQRVCRYNWSSGDMRTLFGGVMISAFVGITIALLVILFG